MGQHRRKMQLGPPLPNIAPPLSGSSCAMNIVTLFSQFQPEILPRFKKVLSNWPSPPGRTSLRQNVAILWRFWASRETPGLPLNFVTACTDSTRKTESWAMDSKLVLQYPRRMGFAKRNTSPWWYGFSWLLLFFLFAFFFYKIPLLVPTVIWQWIWGIQSDSGMKLGWLLQD